MKRIEREEGGADRRKKGEERERKGKEKRGAYSVQISLFKQVGDVKKAILTDTDLAMDCVQEMADVFLCCEEK